MPRRFLCSFALALTGLVSTNAQAGKYDLDLTGLGQIEDGETQVTQDNAGFRSLASEVGTVMAGKPIDPADSLGLSGFAIAADLSINTISGDKDYWKKTASGTPGKSVPTLQVLGRKGLWPGAEVGAGASKLFDSRMWGLIGYGKISIHEGFHHLPIPSIALRGTYTQVLGAKDLNLKSGSVDLSVSHVFGIGSTFNITPYVGYQALMINARSTVIDATPETDEYPDGHDDPPPCSDEPGGTAELPECLSSEFLFKEQDLIVRHRPFVGVRFIFSVMRIGFEAMFVPAGSSGSSVTLADGSTETVKDGSKFQQQYTLSLGLDF